MPRLAGEDETGSDIDDVFEETVAETDENAKKQLNGELKDKVKEDKKKSGSRTSNVDDAADAEGVDEDEEDDDDDEGDGEPEYIVEAIRKHNFIKGQLLYFIKWQGYADSDNTWEPEEHLLPHSRQILANYHDSIRGVPQAPIKRGKSKQSLREAASTDDLRGSKRQKTRGTNESEDVVQPVGSWLPKGDQWEDQVNKVETIERNEETDQLMAYVQFKNGKRSKISMDMVYQYCPRPMLRFYEEHLKFNQVQ